MVDLPPSDPLWGADREGAVRQPQVEIKAQGTSLEGCEGVFRRLLPNAIRLLHNGQCPECFWYQGLTFIHLRTIIGRVQKSI